MDLDKSYLRCAIINGNFREIKEFLDQGIDPNTRFDDGDALIHVASRWGKSNVIDLLLRYGADPLIENAFGNTPLHIASIHCQESAIRYFLRRGIDPDIRNSSGNTPLHEAIYCGNTEAVETLLDYGADPNAQNFYGNTPLHEAVKANKKAVIEILLKYGANPEITNYNKLSPLNMIKDNNVKEFVIKLYNSPLRKILGRKFKDYKIVSIISEGQGHYVLKLIKNDIPYAMEVYERQKEQQHFDLNDEVLILHSVNFQEIIEKISSPYVLRVHEVYYEAPPWERYNKNSLILITDYAQGGTLEEVINIRPDFLKDEKRDKAVTHVIKNITLALNDIHKAGFIHLNVSPSSIYLMKRLNVEDSNVAGLISSIPVKLGNLVSLVKENQLIKSVDFMYSPPERVATEKFDIYQLGLTTYYLMTGKAYNDGKIVRSLMKWHLLSKEEENVYRLLYEKWNSLPTNGIWKLIREMLNPNPMERPTTDELIEKLSVY